MDRTLTGRGEPKISTNDLSLMLKLRRTTRSNTKRKVYSIHKGMILEAY